MKTIVWDVDDVLNELTKEWFSYYLSLHPMKLSYQDLKLNPPHETLAISHTEYLTSLDFFRKQSELSPRAEILDWFESNGPRYHHHVLTAQPIDFAPDGAKWVMKHFGRWIRGFHFVPSPRPTDPDFSFYRDKADFFNHTLLGDFFVDDSSKNIQSVGGLKVTGLLFPQPWNDQSLSVAEVLRQISP